MNQIKSLADELRETIKKDGDVKANDNKSGRSEKDKKKSVPALDKLFEDILTYELIGNEKLLIRLNDRTIFLLKQLKVAKAIDMNKFIAYSVHDFLNRHPELIHFIKENIRTIEI